MGDHLLSGRAAAERGAWEEAFEALTAADERNRLDPEDLLLLADAAWWSGHPDDGVAALERAHAAQLDRGDRSAAAMAAIQLAYLAFRRLSVAVGQGWMGKAISLLEDEPESPAHAWLALIQMADAMLVRGDLDDGISFGEIALDLAERNHAPAVAAMAKSFKGYALITKGDWEAGLDLVDRATTSAVSGELDLRSACDVYCNTIACCRDLGDYRRASEWTEEADRWMQRHSLGGYPGICRVHRAELKRFRGSYEEAEREARAASLELERYHLLDGVGLAFNEIGQVRLHRGDLDGAEQAFMEAYEYGHDALPGLALLLLARGEAQEAADLIGRRLDRGGTGPGEDRMWRARLLPARVTIALAAGDVDAARTSVSELEAIAEMVPRPAHEAAALTSRGELLAHEGSSSDAVELLDRAWRRWREIELPYESARARMLLGVAEREAGRPAAGRMDLMAARSAMERIGAARDVRLIEELLGGGTPTGGRSRRSVETFVFTDIVASTDLVSLIGDEAWESLLGWHDRTLREEFARHGGREVRHTGDGFFVVFERASDAVEAAVSIQRRLAEHRRREGFAPWIRIGVHTTEATPEGGDFSGQGVHVAARIGDLGGRDDIVVSADTLEAAGGIRFPTGDPRSVELKGVPDPVDVREVDWRP